MYSNEWHEFSFLGNFNIIFQQLEANVFESFSLSQKHINLLLVDLRNICKNALWPHEQQKINVVVNEIINRIMKKCT